MNHPLRTSDDPARTTPIGMTRYAAEFMEAAIAADAQMGTKGMPEQVAPAPVMFLIGQSIELALKAYMLHQGVSLRDLRVTYSHGLLRSYRKARELGFSSHFTSTGPELVALELLDRLYESRQLQYIVTGARRVPPFSVLKSMALRLLHATSLQVGYPLHRLPQ